VRKFLYSFVISLCALLFLLPSKAFAGLPDGWPCVYVTSGTSVCTSGYCKTVTKIPGTPGVCKPVYTCSCLTTGANNEYQCIVGLQKIDFTCQTSYRCVNDNSGEIFPISSSLDGGIKGVKCAPIKSTGSAPKSAATPTPTTVPPAAIPCANLLPNGKCIAVNTSLGIFSTEPGPFIVRVFGVLLAVSGSIAVILFMRAGYKIMSARGNPEGIKDGREQLVAAILGLMFLIFSFVLLQVIAADLLKIPGF
jgi:hypothetical protein